MLMSEDLPFFFIPSRYLMVPSPPPPFSLCFNVKSRYFSDIFPFRFPLIWVFFLHYHIRFNGSCHMILWLRKLQFKRYWIIAIFVIQLVLLGVLLGKFLRMAKSLIFLRLGRRKEGNFHKRVESSYVWQHWEIFEGYSLKK